MDWGSNSANGRLSLDTPKAIIQGQSGMDLSFGANGLSDQLYIKSGGSVGIGTTTPNAKLQVMGSVNATGLCLSGDCKVAWSDIVSAGGVGTGTNGQTLRNNNGTGWVADSNIYND